MCNFIDVFHDKFSHLFEIKHIKQKLHKIIK